MRKHNNLIEEWIRTAQCTSFILHSVSSSPHFLHMSVCFCFSASLRLFSTFSVSFYVDNVSDNNTCMPCFCACVRMSVKWRSYFYYFYGSKGPKANEETAWWFWSLVKDHHCVCAINWCWSTGVEWIKCNTQNNNHWIYNEWTKWAQEVANIRNQWNCARASNIDK